ncbi:MAG: helix-hairpin-helix domain-containing protein [Desulfobulbaceae bacterium]|nr:helix-hairpin-helix domain-containing protein [Desulfobulbaceae bacterium]
MITVKNIGSLVLGSALAFSVCVSNSFAEEKTGIPSLSAVADKASAVAESGSLADLININNATPEMLAKIPGIGPKLGEAITAYRDANGTFTQLKDLLNVEGIDMSLLEKVKPFLKF